MDTPPTPPPLFLKGDNFCDSLFAQKSSSTFGRDKLFRKETSCHKSCLSLQKMAVNIHHQLVKRSLRKKLRLACPYRHSDHSVACYRGSQVWDLWNMHHMKSDLMADTNSDDSDQTVHLHSLTQVIHVCIYMYDLSDWPESSVCAYNLYTSRALLLIASLFKALLA